jgi:hypothetical protein
LKNCKAYILNGLFVGIVKDAEVTGFLEAGLDDVLEEQHHERHEVCSVCESR